MLEIETLEIIEQIQSLVSDQLQVVSYKWLSRKFLVSSIDAKRLLQEFVEKHEDKVEVIYCVAGWLKETPATYHIKLVPKPKLAEAKCDFDGNCSVQVYSVQSSIPKDVAAIWNTEFIQTEELFKQPLTVNNCLRDNRFSGVSNSLVNRNAEGAALAVTALKGKGVIGNSVNQVSSVPQPQNKVPQSIPKVGLQSSNVVSAKTETDKSAGRDLQKEAVKDKLPLPPSKKKGHSDKSPAGGSLTNLWGRASSKSNSSKGDKDVAQNNGVPISADAQISAIENSEAVSSDDDEPDVNFRRTSNGDGGKKRRVMLDDSDEDDLGDAVNLGSPDPPKAKSFPVSKLKNDTLVMKNNLLNDEQEEIIPVKEEKATSSELNNPFKTDFAALDQGKKVNKASSVEKEVPQKTAGISISKKNKATDPAPGSPKRKKVLKTRIDERGREVTEVVWEGEEDDVKQNNAGKTPNVPAVKAEDNAVTNPAPRAATTKKSPATGNTGPAQAAGRGGGKKGANVKDPKQGNILAFFKKKV